MTLAQHLAETRDNMATFATDEDEPLYTLSNVAITINSTTTNSGTITISQPSLRWQNTDLDYEYKWTSIMLHAVCREGVDQPKILIQLEDNTELYITPSTDVCDDIFAAMCTAAELNPEEDDDNETNGENVWFNQGDDESKLAAYDALLSMNGIVNGQFDDAEETTSPSGSHWPAPGSTEEAEAEAAFLALLPADAVQLSEGIYTAK